MDDMNDMLKRVALVIDEQTGNDARDITAESKLVDDLYFDDLDMVDVAIALAEEFDLSADDISDDDIATWEAPGATVQSILDTLKTKVS